MEQLSRIAQGLLIGNGEVWNFLDYAVNRNVSSLISYTQNNNFLPTNLFNNFNGGDIRRNSNWLNIKPTGNYGLLKNGDGRLTTNANAVGDYIGDLYSIEDNPNSALRFVSVDEFTKFQKEIRSLALLKRRRSKNEDRVPKTTYLYDGGVPSYNDEFLGYYAENFKGRRNFGDEYEVKEVLKPNNRRHKTLEEIRDIFKNNLFGIVGKTNKYISKSIRQDELYIYDYDINNLEYRATTSNQDLFTDGINTKNLKISIVGNKLNVGLEDYYSGYREKYLEKEKKHPSTNWRHSNSYGVDFKNVGEENFSLNERRKKDNNTNISPEFINGDNVKYNPKAGTASYTYFQEPDGETIPGSLNVNGCVYNWNSVALSDYNDSSRLLKKTNELFRNHKINSLINRFHTDTKDVNSELISSYDNNFGISRGRNLIRKQYEGKQIGDKFTGYDNPYCRVWTAHHQYSKLKDRIRPFVDEDGEPLSIAETQSNYGNLRPRNGGNRLSEHSVLKSDGYLRITPTYGDKGEYIDHQKYMFSLENLAWRDIGTGALTTEQRGPKGGRIMWFPPYNLKFSENVTVNWNANSFIGRGEEIYTYTNTLRSGTLDFTLLIDHPSVLNKFRGTSGEVNNKEEVERDILRYFAGCGNLNDDVEPYKEKEENKPTTVAPQTTPIGKKKTYKVGYVVFFPNNFSGIDNEDLTMQSILLGYNTSSATQVSNVDKKYENQSLKDKNYVSVGIDPSKHKEDIKRIIFESSVDEIKFINDIIDLDYALGASSANTAETPKIYGFEAETCKISNVIFKGFASSQGYGNLNNELCNRRRTIMEKLIGMNCDALKESENVVYTRLDGSVMNVGKTEDINELSVKLSRAAYAIVEVEWKDENKAKNEILDSGATATMVGYSFEKSETKNPKDEKRELSNVTEVDNENDYSYDNEYLYFSSLRGDSIEYKNIVDKVRYFEPAFHSITPEGFNARLTFLHQCTRQGPTNAVSSGNVNRDSNDYLKFAGNLAFGRAPYCILRIGDFFHTKICIDSLSISYDNNGVQWDLNPEGAGVQPMYANISISFKFIGGQDISGPIERLQNAVTANYYANASVYSRHADDETSYYDAIHNTNVIK